MLFRSVDEAEGVPFLVMPLLEGESLHQLLSRGPLNRREARRITLEVASALRAAHACGLVHRDVKPSNIWIRRKADGSESAMLLEFGVALPSEAGGSTSGSAGYKSPEQSLGAPCDPRTDCFALGCVVFEMLTGRKAWPSSQADLAKLTLPAADPAVPTAWRPLLRSLLSLDPAARPATMEEVAGLVPPEARPKGALVACGLMLALMLACQVYGLPGEVCVAVSYIESRHATQAVSSTGCPATRTRRVLVSRVIGPYVSEADGLRAGPRRTSARSRASS